MMTPLRCERRGGDQEKVSVRDVVENIKVCGCPLGTAETNSIIVDLRTVLTIL